MPERGDIEELLPAYVNGTLDPDEARRVEQALRDDPGLAEECRFLSALREEVRRDAAATPPGEMGWHRLRRSIERERPSAPGAGGRFWRPAAAVAAAVIVAQAALLWRAHQPDETGYVPLAAERTGQIQVRFEPDATAGEIRALLADADLEIVSGPGASGVYRLGIAGDASEAEIEALVRRLAERDAIVAHVARE